jgi:hypothetical protein
MFCFGLSAKSRAIGNLVLAPEQYASIKKKLLGEMAEMLRRERGTFGLFDVIGAIKEPLVGDVLGGSKGNFEPIEQAFKATSSTIFGGAVDGNCREYGDYLSEYLPYTQVQKKTGNLLVPNIFARKETLHRVVGAEQAKGISANAIGSEDAAKITYDKGALAALLSKIAYVCPITVDGVNSNMIDVPISRDSMDCYHGQYAISKKSAYSALTRSSEHVFGSVMTFNGKFLIRCNSVFDSARCFEADSCKNSMDLYFCHNCENVNDGMFCFNTKAKGHCIGNSELNREEYAKIKRDLLAQMREELSEKKRLKNSIFNLGGN